MGVVSCRCISRLHGWLSTIACTMFEAGNWLQPIQTRPSDGHVWQCDVSGCRKPRKVHLSLSACWKQALHLAFTCVLFTVVPRELQTTLIVQDRQKIVPPCHVKCSMPDSAALRHAAAAMLTNVTAAALKHQLPGLPSVPPHTSEGTSSVNAQALPLAGPICARGN